MEPLQRHSLYNEHCSCTSYGSTDTDDRITSELYRKINKKYYLPSKEDELLEQIFKTRTLCEILRSQLISTCTCDIKKTDVKCRPSSVYYWEAPEKAKKYNDLFTLYDEGAVLGIKGLSETCSCCSCRLKSQLHEYVRKRRRNRQAYINENIVSKSSLSSKQDNGATKNIKSDPCTCACKHKHKKDFQIKNLAQKFHDEQPEIRQRNRISITEKCKPLSLNNKKRTYYKLKQCFTPRMENIGEETIRKTQNFTKLSQHNTDIKRLASMEILSLLQNEIKGYSDINALSKFTRENQRIVQTSSKESLDKDAFIKSVDIQFVDTTCVDHKQNVETDRSYSVRSRKYKQYKRISNESNINTAATNIKKTKNVTDLVRSANKQQKTLEPILIQNNKICVNMLQISNQKPTKSNTSDGIVKRSSKSLASMLPPTLEPNMTDKHFRLINNAEKESSRPTKTDTSRMVVKILKSISTSSIKKNSWLYNKNATVGDDNITLKINLSTSFHKLVTMLSSPMQIKIKESMNPHLSPSLVKTKQELPKLEKQCHKKKSHSHKNPSLLQTAHKKKQHKIKVRSEHKSSIALRRCFCNFNIRIKDARSRISKSNRRTKLKESKFSIHDLTHTYTYKYGQSSSIKSLNIKKKKRRKGDQHYQHQLRKWVELQLKMDLVSKKLTKQAVQIQKIPCATLKSSIPTSASVLYNPNMKTNNKESENGIINKELDTNNKSKTADNTIISESSTHQNTKSTLKDASIGNDDKQTFQNQSVQTINNRQSCGVQFENKTTSDYGPKVIGIMPSKQQRNKSNASKPVFKVIFFIKNWGNGLRRFRSILKLGKLTNKYKKWRKVELFKETLNQKHAEIESFQTKVNNEFYEPFKNDFGINKEERKAKQIIKNIIYKSRANTKLSSQLLNFPRTKNIKSILSQKCEIYISKNKFANSARKFFNGLYFTGNEESFPNTSKVSKSRTGKKRSHKLTLFDSKKQGSGKSAPKMHRCLYSLKLHKRGKYNKKKGVINIELKSKIRSDKMYPSFPKDSTSTKSKYSNPRRDQSQHSKQLILLFMPHKCNPYSENKNNNPKSLGHCSNTKTISVNLSNTRKVTVDHGPSKLLYVEKVNCKQRSRLFKRIKYLEKQPKIERLSEYAKEIHLENSPMQIFCHEIMPVPNKSFRISNILKNDKQRCDNKLPTPFAPRKPTQVYTVNTVTLTETKISSDVLRKEPHRDSTDTLDLTQFDTKIGSEISCVNNNWSKKLSLRSVQSLSNVLTQNDTGILPLLKRRYSATNIHEGDQKVRRSHPNNSPRLNAIPYQRQKFIVGRLVSKISTMLSNEKRFKTNHTSTLSATTTARKHLLRLGNKVKHHTACTRPIVGFKYQTSPRSRQPHKRIGYTFGFSKDYPNCKSRAIQSTQTYDRHFKKSSGCDNASSRYRRPSQWAMSQVSHGISNVTPILRGCVCALKLHKKGRLQKAREMEVMNQGKATLIKINADEPIIRPLGKVQNIQNDHYLELETCKCEPGICIPDECDSIWRLILGKKRVKQTKDFETDSITSHFSSSSDMTPSWERIVAHEYGGRSRLVRCRNMLPRTHLPDIIIGKSAIQLSRQSNNVNSRKKLKEEIDYDLITRDPRHFRKNTSTHVKTKDKLSKDRKQKHLTDFQTDLHEHSHSTVTSRFLKRCYCTLKVLVTSRNCHDKPSKVGNERTTPILTTVVKTQKHGVIPPLLLQDYEYDEPMKIKKPKEKRGATTRSRTKFTSSSTYMRPSKSERTQYKSTTRRRKYHPKEMLAKEKTQRPTVQFGSANYSEVRVAAMKCSRPKRYKSRVHFKKIPRNKRSRNISNLYRNRESQMNVSKSKAKSLGRKLRRCFCTLKFHTQKPVFRKGTVSSHKEVSRHFWGPKNLKSLPYNLKHYECEPLVCVPGECNPYKCQNRSKRLLMRCSSISEDREPPNVMQRPKLIIRKHPYGERKIQYITNVVHTTSKRTEKITANNNFYLDYFKDKTLGDSCLPSKPNQDILNKKPRRVTNKSTGNLKKHPKGKAKCSKNTYAKCKNPNKSNKSTRNRRKIRCKRECQSHTSPTKDKSLNVALLKRCFRTAKSWSNRSRLRPETSKPDKKTIMSSNDNKCDKNDNKCHPADNSNDTKELTLKNLFKFCKNFFNEQSGEAYNQNRQMSNSTETPNNKQPLVDIIKPSKSEGRPIAATSECIKKSKSLKVAKADRKVVYIKDYDQFQSGDADSLFKKKSGFKSNIRKVCPNSQVQLEQSKAVFVKKKVHFAAACSNITVCVKATKQKEDFKPILCLFESKNSNHGDGISGSCECAKRKTYPCPASKDFNLQSCKIVKPQTQRLEYIYIRPRIIKHNKNKRSKKGAKPDDKMYEEKKHKKLKKTKKNA